MCATIPYEALAKCVLVDVSPRAVAALERDTLSGPERPRVAHVPVERHEAALAGEDVLVGGLDVPQRTQAERVDAEHAGVAHAREDRGGPLRQRAERGARLDIDVLQLAAHALHLVDDRWEQELDGLDRRQPLAQDEPADDRVDVLRIAPIARKHQSQSARLLAQAADRIDLAVVGEHRERLHAGEARGRVGGVAVVTKRR